MTKYLCLFSHPDDEIFTLSYLMSNPGKYFLIYATEDKGLESVRAIELLHSISLLNENGINCELVQFNKRFSDGNLYKELNKEFIDFINKFIEDENPEALITLAFEGGHQDHDTVSYVSSILANKHHLPVFRFSAYRNSDRKFFPYIVMRPVIKLNKIKFEKVKVFFLAIKLMLCYKSQWKTWLGLAPFIVYRYLSGEIFIDGYRKNIFSEKKSLYEKRNRAIQSDVIKSLEWIK